MDMEGPEGDLLRDPYQNARQRGNSARATFFRFLVYFTFGVAFLFLAISIFLVLNPTWGTSLSQPVQPYFFVFLGVFVLSPVPLVSIFVVMFALYIVFFITLVLQTGRKGGKKVLDTPIGYLVAVATAVELISFIISEIERYFGTPIGGGGIDSQLQNNPLLGYMGLIYAPFVEELGFRILPLGVYSFFLIAYASARSGGYARFGDSLISIILPGQMRKKYGIRMTGLDWVLIITTSLIFAYAHIYFGAWDWGKFIPVFITGIALAIGFLKFGIYVDIPLHWFFNGLLTQIYLDPVMLFPTGLLVLWVLFVGAVSLIVIAYYFRSWRRSGSSSS